MNELLLVIESILFLLFSIMLFCKERIYGFYFFFILVYAIFAQIGYLYFPELSATGHAYFGEEIWKKCTYFIILSGISLFLFLYYGSSRVIKIVHSSRILLQVHEAPSMLARRVVCILIALSLVAQYCIYFADSDGLSWSTVQNEDIYQLDFLAGAFMFMMKFSLALNLALYCTLRQIRILANSKHLPVLAVISMASFMIFTFKVGSRTDTLALFLGIAVFEAGRIRFTARRIVAVGVIVCTLYAYLSVLGNHRTEQSGVDTDRLTRILVSDYYAPAHMLFAAVAYQYIDPEEVITSNAANTLVLMHHPYLQATVTDLFLPGVATRSQGFAFYNFTEGYLFAGFSGFLYNGVVLGFLMALWRSCATTNSEKLNHFLLAIMGSMVIGLIRGQCSYFIKIMYTFIIPGAVVYLALNGMRLRLWVRQKA